MNLTSFSLLAALSGVLVTTPVFSQNLTDDQPRGGTDVLTNPVPTFSHIVVVIGENTSVNDVYNNSNAPYINGLATDGAKFTNSFALFHPSQPNYIGLYSGDSQGITNDNLITTVFTTKNLGRSLIDAQKTYVTYSEGLPSVGYNGKTSGKYARKHNPAANWMGTGVNQIPVTTNQPFTAFPTNFNDLPSVSMVVPDLCSDGHDLCAPINNSVKQYDTWVKTNLDAYKQWCINNNSLLIVTYDEDDNTAVNKIASVFYGAHVVPGVYAQTVNHYSILRTIEDAFQLTTHAGAAATTNPIDFCWNNVVSAVTNANTPAETPVLVYPNPFHTDLNVQFSLDKESEVQIDLYDLLGQHLFQRNTVLDASNQTLRIQNNEMPAVFGPLMLVLRVNGVITSSLVQRY